MVSNLIIKILVTVRILKMIKSISKCQDTIINSILKLHNNNESIELDPTYSKGIFYKGNIQKPKYRFDIKPYSEDVSKACCTDLPFEDNTIASIMFDPPFLATKGKSLSKDDNSNLINKRFSVFPTEKELFQFYDKSLLEFYRIMKKNGILIFKCQDKVSSGKQYFSHCYIHDKAKSIGFYPIDFFVLEAKSRMIPKWQRNQKHARKYHSYFWVFKKCSKSVSYSS